MKTNFLKIIKFSAILFFIFSLVYIPQSPISNIKKAEAAIITPLTGGIVVYADGTAGTPKYKVFDDSTGFGAEQSASSVGAVAIE